MINYLCYYHCDIIHTHVNGDVQIYGHRTHLGFLIQIQYLTQILTLSQSFVIHLS